MRRRLAYLIAVLSLPALATACGEGARESTRERPRPQTERVRVDTRARLDVSGAPPGVVVELDGAELIGVVLLPPGRRTVRVFADGVPVGARDVELRSGRTTVLDLVWAPAALRGDLASHPLRVTDDVPAGLVWLTTHRAPDGTWSASAFAESCPDDARCDGATAGVADAEATGLALLAFLGAGETPEQGACRRVVRAGFDGLVARQDEAGRFTADARGQAIATAALAELCVLTPGGRFREPAQRAVEALLRMRTPARGWAAVGAPDAAATAWGCIAVASARRAGLSLVTGLEAELLRDLAAFGDPGGAQVGARASALLTLARLLLGSSVADAEVASGLGRILARPPMAGESLDPAALWAGAAVVVTCGGKDAWTRWSRAMREQPPWRAQGPGGLFEHGPSGVPGQPPAGLGRLRSVAYACLAQRVYFRGGRVLGITAD